MISRKRTRIERIPSTPLHLVQQQLNHFILDTQSLDITHPVNLDALLSTMSIFPAPREVRSCVSCHTFRHHMPSVNFILPAKSSPSIPPILLNRLRNETRKRRKEELRTSASTQMPDWKRTVIRYARIAFGSCEDCVELADLASIPTLVKSRGSLRNMVGCLLVPSTWRGN